MLVLYCVCMKHHPSRASHWSLRSGAILLLGLHSLILLIFFEKKKEALDMLLLQQQQQRCCEASSWTLWAHRVRAHCYKCHQHQQGVYDLLLLWPSTYHLGFWGLFFSQSSNWLPSVTWKKEGAQYCSWCLLLLCYYCVITGFQWRPFHCSC